MPRRFIACTLIGLLAFGLIHVIATQTRLFLGMERSLLSGYFHLREYDIREQNPLVSDELIIAGFDEDSIAFIGKWPWKRYVHGRFLHNVEAFSPRAVFFDVVFVQPETAPPYILHKFEREPALQKRVEGAFSEMDALFADALRQYSNVYLDLQLVEEPRPWLPLAYQEGIRFNERVMEAFSQPVRDNPSPIVFHSLEPLLQDFAAHAHPVVINILPDDDGVTRVFPLYYTYRTSDHDDRNLFTAVLALIQRYYRVHTRDIVIRPSEVILRSATVPRLDPDTHQLAVCVQSFHEIVPFIRNPRPPDGYPYNRNLYVFLVNQLLAGIQTPDRIPLFPLHLLQSGDHGFELLDGWEILDAAVRARSAKIQAVFYRTSDIHIETPLPGSFHINYPGREKRHIPDPDTGKPLAVAALPTVSYGDVYGADDLPDIPMLGENGTLPADRDVRAIEQWYDRWFGQNAFAAPGRPERDPEKGVQMVQALMDVYGDYFRRYYRKFVFAGATAVGLGDLQQTPCGVMSGVSTIASAFNTLATDNPLTFSSDIPGLDTLLLIGICLLCSVLYAFTSVRVSAVLFAFLLAGTLCTGFLLFDARNLYVKAVPLLFANAGVFISVIMYKVLTEQRDKRFLKSTFASYLAPAIIDKLIADRRRPVLGGEAMIITAYFTDIEGFSTLSEILPPQEVVSLINEYLTAMTDILLAEGGTLDKYEGDAIVAFFGAPLRLPDHSLRACRTALAMQARLRELRRKWAGETRTKGTALRPKGMPADAWQPGDQWPRSVHRMRMRIGINTGEIVVGNVGSATRMNYTMMGDPVNLAARLEALGKQYGAYTLVSEHVLGQEIEADGGEPIRVMDRVEARFIDRIIVEGRSNPVRVYELFAMKGGLTEQERRLFDAFEKGMAHFLKMEWDDAVACFRESLTLEPRRDATVNPSRVYIARCRTLKSSPPSPSQYLSKDI